MKTPKEIKDFLNNKVLVNISGNTPKVETISIDNFLEWFESGVLIPNEFYYLQKGTNSWVIQFKEFIANEWDSIPYYYMLKIHDNGLISDFSCANNGWGKATPAQKQQLIDKVQEETGKVWNEDTKMFEDKPKEILVPCDIQIVKNNNRRQLGIGFNEYRQVVFFDKEANVYQVLPITKHDYLQQCKLVLCRHEDLEVGDIFTTSYALLNNLLTDLDAYLMKLSEETICFIQDSDCVIISGYDFEDYVERKIDFYKLVEVNKK